VGVALYLLGENVEQFVIMLRMNQIRPLGLTIFILTDEDGLSRLVPIFGLAAVAIVLATTPIMITP
jgi:hypothetical protein